MPKLSVLMPAYNAEEFIGATIKSILSQSFTDFELIISDDGSTDSTRTIIGSFSDKRIKQAHNTTNLGKVATVNRLFSLASGEYITIHDADDISLPTRFERQMERFTDDTGLIMNGCFFEEFSESDSRTVTLPTEYIEIKTHLLKESTFHGPTMIFKRNILANGYVYRDFFKDYNEDVDLAYRICATGKCENVADVLYRYRINPKGLSKRRKSPELLAYSSFIIELYKQRIATGYDILDTNPRAVDVTWTKHVQLYIQNPYAVFDRNAGFFLSYKFYGKVFKEWFLLFKQRPFRWKTWRALLYVTRKSVFQII